MQSRVNYIDGLRGVAILLVMAFHAYARWPAVVPYGDQFMHFPLFSLGWIGVELFFLISGFVIFMSLDKTPRFGTFMYKRWLRLFPGMLVASILVYFTAPLFQERPIGMPHLIDLLPGLTFIAPSWWSILLDRPINPFALEGVFWSLYVEFKFYFIAGLVYFALGRKLLAPILFLLFMASIAISQLDLNSNIALTGLLSVVIRLLSLKYFGWFCAGSLFYLYHQNKKEWYFLMAIAVAAISSVSSGESFGPIIAGLFVSGLFALSLRVVLLQKLLTNKLFMLFGFISYPLYLIHENAMVAMIVKSPTLTPWLNSFFYPVLPIMLLVCVAYFIATVVEPQAKRAIDYVVRCKANYLLKRA